MNEGIRERECDIAIQLFVDNSEKKKKKDQFIRKTPSEIHTHTSSQQRHTEQTERRHELNTGNLRKKGSV